MEFIHTVVPKYFTIYSEHNVCWSPIQYWLTVIFTQHGTSTIYVLDIIWLYGDYWSKLSNMQKSVNLFGTTWNYFCQLKE